MPGRLPVLALALLCCCAVLGACTSGGNPARRPASATAGAAAVRSPAAATGKTRLRSAQASPEVDWPVFDFNPQRSGVNPNETAITAATVAGLQRLWTQALPEKADSPPILLSGVAMPDGTTADLLFVTSAHGTTVAINAQSGAIVWQQPTNGPIVAGQRCQVCATPAAGASRQWIYAAGVDGAVHRYAAATGQEDTTAPWPVTVTLLNGFEKRSGSLNVANGYLYVPLSGYFGDFGPYVGHIVAIHLPDGASQVFNALCSDQHTLIAPVSVVPSSPASCSSREAGVWARAGVVIDQSGGPTDGQLFFATGNGPFDANNGGVDYGDSVLRLSPDASTLIDSFTPTNHTKLDQQDLDLGSTAPALLPQQPRSNTPWMFVQGGKDSILHVVDRTRMGGVGGDLQTINLASGEVYTAPAIWQDPAMSDPSGDNTWCFVATNYNLFGFRLVTDASGASHLVQQWKVGSGGTSPIVAGGVLFIAGNGRVTARDPLTGRALWNSAQASAGGGVGAIHWQSPIVVNGALYITDVSGNISAYGLGGQ